MSELVNLEAVQYHEGLGVFPFFSFLVRALSLLDCKVVDTVLGNTCTCDTADRKQWAYFFAVPFNQRKPFPKCPHRLPLRFAAQNCILSPWPRPSLAKEISMTGLHKP